jgi:hypothetical protein
LFTINAATGALAFTAPRDFEVATDANGDNVYVVQVRVTDSQGASTTQTIQVTVTDVAEISLPSTGGTPLPPSLVPTAPPVPPPISPPPVGGTVPTPVISAPPEPVGPRLASEYHPSNRSFSAPVPTKERTSSGQLEELRRPNDPVSSQTLPHVQEDPGRPLFNILPVEPTQDLDQEQPSQPASVSDILIAKLDAMTASLEEAIGVDQEQHTFVARITAVTGTSLSVGFVAWAVRSSALLASALATMPAWKHFDPLPVVKLNRRDRNRRRADAEADQRREASEFGGLQQLFDENPPSSSNRN